MPDEAGWVALREELAREERRVVDRLRGLSLDRLGRSSADGRPAPADAARACAQALADLAADLEAAPAPGRHRAVPGLAAHATGDQVAVTAHDVALAAAAHAPDDVVAGHGTALAVVRAAVDALVALRRSLP